MYRSIRIALSAGVILLASAAVPPMLPDSTTMSLSGSALAQKTPTSDSINLNSSRSNIYRKGAPGNGQQPPAPPEAITTIKSTKSNTSYKTMQPGNGQQPPAPPEATTSTPAKSSGAVTFGREKLKGTSR
jgi:hypothetical protein